MDDNLRLQRAAQDVRRNAYAPYSGYRVGAALLDEQERIFVGCNVENISYGGCICAERHAIGAMIAAGGKRITKLVVATLDGGTPCGICLQSIAEFAEPELPITLLSDEGSREVQLQELLPQGFKSDAVARAT